MLSYIVNNRHDVKIGDSTIIDNASIVEAIHFANKALRNLDAEVCKYDINIFETLGMRNLSGMIGEYFAKSVQQYSNKCLASNPHQDGYPDLLLVDTDEKKKYLESLFVENCGKTYPISKEVFSPFKYGGIEVKATCGSTPPASTTTKPLIGEQRIDLLNSFDWKAHHRETNNLLAILWDFIDDVPTIVACFYRNDLTIDDWSKIVQPKEDGGRTTSVSIMTSAGVKKMCTGWIAILDNRKYTCKLAADKWVGYDIRNY